MRSLCCRLVLALTCSATLTGLRAEPSSFFLTWKDDPCTTMIVDWHVPEREPIPAIEFRREGSGAWTSLRGAESAFPFARLRLVRRELDGLDPGTTYEFRFGPEGKVRTFRTMPRSLEKPVTFAIGGDTRHQTAWFEKMNRLAVAQDPDFVVLGGDLAYENGESGNVANVIDWFETCARSMVTSGGRVVPVLVAIGNHEVRGGFVGSPLAKSLRERQPPLAEDAIRSELAPYFYTLFASPGQPGYRALDFGDYLSLILLDSNHTNAVEAAQRDWLEATLAARSGRPNVFPVYHVPAYPSVRPFNEPVSKLVRENWVPLFEKFGVELAFENHDHAYKRTKPLRSGKPDPSGITFLGDGAWGVDPRPTHPDAWYLEKSAGVRNCLIITLRKDGRSIRAYDENGSLLDSL